MVGEQSKSRQLNLPKCPPLPASERALPLRFLARRKVERKEKKGERAKACLDSSRSAASGHRGFVY